MDNRPIGYFDSGIGGLTALKAALELMPYENTIYIADEAHLPYGTKTQKEIISLSRKIVNQLVKKQVKAIICACNTSSALALPTIQKEFKIPILGVIKSGSKKAIQITNNRKIIVLATQATVKSHKYDEELLKLTSSLKIKDYPAQDLVAIAESGDYQNPKNVYKINELMAPLKNEPADTMILGCTHFPILEKQLATATNNHFQFVDSGREAVKVLQKYLITHQMAHSLQNQTVEHSFYTTGDPSHFKNVGNQFITAIKIDASNIDLG